MTFKGPDHGGGSGSKSPGTKIPFRR